MSLAGIMCITRRALVGSVVQLLWRCLQLLELSCWSWSCRQLLRIPPRLYVITMVGKVVVKRLPVGLTHILTCLMVGIGGLLYCCPVSCPLLYLPGGIQRVWQVSPLSLVSVVQVVGDWHKLLPISSAESDKVVFIVTSPRRRWLPTDPKEST